MVSTKFAINVLKVLRLLVGGFVKHIAEGRLPIKALDTRIRDREQRSQECFGIAWLVKLK